MSRSIRTIRLAHALRVNPSLQTLVVSAQTGEGLAAFSAWIEARHARAAAQAQVSRTG
jgi:hydrogenase nickel incorporation protein HypB